MWELGFLLICCIKEYDSLGPFIGPEDIKSYDITFNDLSFIYLGFISFCHILYLVSNNLTVIVSITFFHMKVFRV